MELLLSCYGVEFRVSFDDAETAAQARTILPPEFSVVTGLRQPVGACRIHVEPGEGWRRDLERDLRKQVALRARDWLFVHAGTVGWKGWAIVIPGRSWSGKSRLVEALVRAGATYYSDEYAVFDRDGLVHSYTRPLSVRDGFGVRQLVDLDADAATPREPIPVALVLATRFRAGEPWRPAVRRGAQAVLPLIDATIPARLHPERVLRLAARLAASVVTLQGARAEARPVAEWTLRLLDEVLSANAGDGDRRELGRRLFALAQQRVGEAPERSAAPTAEAPSLSGPRSGLPFCFIHLGSHAPPSHLLDAIDQVQLWNPSSPIFVALDGRHVASFAKQLRETRIDAATIVLVDVASLPETEHHGRFRASHRLDEVFRDGFWRHTTERFFVLEELIEAHGLEEVIHLENDVMLYCDMSAHCEALRPGGDLAVTSDDPSRVVPGLVYVRGREVLRELNRALANAAGEGRDDMWNLGRFLAWNGHRVATLPLVMPAYEPRVEARYTDGFERFASVFDACALGQYLGGIDPRNVEPGTPTVGFINETAAFSCARLEFQWMERDGLRRPACRPAGGTTQAWTAINNLHVHAKALHRFSSRLWLAEEEILSGERLQGLADVSIVPDDIYRFHAGVERFAREIFHVDAHDAVDEAAVRYLSAKRSFFVYTHALPEFARHIWPRLRGGEYVLVTHNSDHEIDATWLPLLEDPRLRRWLAQNATIAHPKLAQIPIGLANSMWPHGDVGVLHDAVARNLKRRKTELAYLHFNLSTHAQRPAIWSALRRSFPQAAAAPGEPQPFDVYLENLARHQFALCPRGNGIDTHRLWEALYLDVIPVVERSVHTKSWQQLGLPLVLVDDWSEVTPDFLTRAGERLVGQPFPRDPLRLSHYRMGPGSAGRR